MMIWQYIEGSIVKDHAEGILTVMFGIYMIFSRMSPIFMTQGQGLHENRQSYGHSKNKTLRETSLNMA